MEIRIAITKEDITKLKVDAIVNAANTSLLGGGGVDGAIHRAAGSQLLEECRTLNGCLTGEAKITKAYDLPAKFIIHTVGPVWRKDSAKVDDLLAGCYRNSLTIAKENNCKTIAFPNISTGVYHFPKKAAAEIAVKEVKKFLKNDSSIEKVIFVCFDFENYNIYEELLGLV
ncbi:MAG: O-acetyl-ADP-ribose deacetylase [Bacteroidales bacterium]|nr:O-acetyl-ADP-ribose deacetylase [Bacteroidales bacterium]